jgi:putative transposase
MPYTRILIHTVWATKDRKPILSKETKDLICNHILEYALSKEIHLIQVNGWLDHLHAFISMRPEQNVCTLMNLIKGESSFWANRNIGWKGKFGWQDDYFAVSVSQSHCERVTKYIMNQEEHHRKKKFQEEYDEFIKGYGFLDK